MRRFSIVAGLVAIALLFVAGCEYSSKGSGGGYTDSGVWGQFSFSGVYQPASGQSYLVSAFTDSTNSTSGTTVNASDVIGTGGNHNTSFSGTLTYVPVVIGSITVSYSGESLVDGNGDGNLEGSHGSTGTINYDTGAVTVNFASDPSDGEQIVVTYLYYKAGTAQNPSPGSTDEIRNMTVSQQGNALSFVDSNGGQYAGSFTDTTIPVDLVSNAVQNFAMSATFEVTGTSAGGAGVTMVGTFQGTYTQTAVDAPAYISGKQIEGTWIEDSGKTGNLAGFSN